MLLQLLTWNATSQEASALAEGEPKGAEAVVVVVLEETEVEAEVAAEAAAEAAAEVTETVAGAAAGVGGADLELSVKAKAAATGQAKLAEQQLGVNQKVACVPFPDVGSALSASQFFKFNPPVGHLVQVLRTSSKSCCFKMNLIRASSSAVLQSCRSLLCKFISSRPFA